MIKVKPEEFIVEEKASLPLTPAGSYRVYRLTKRGLTTEDACRLIARHLGLAPSAIAYGGRKDKHGLTSQHITIRHPEEINFEEKNIRLEPLGFMARPMGPDLILGNSFRVTLRRLADTDSILRNAEEVKASGFPNFFDDQRFRSYDPQRGFFAEKILKRHWKGALQVYLTSITPSLKKRERERRLAFLAHWRDWSKCLELAQKPAERKILSALAVHPSKPEQALKFIPPEEVSFLYAAYQAHLWNELLRRIIRQRRVPFASVPGREGEYLFWLAADEEVKTYFASLLLPTAAPKMDFPDELTRPLFLSLLQEKGLTLSSFRTRSLRLVSFRSFLRPATAFPLNLKVIESGDDELYPGKKKVVLSFYLGRGSYGTMLIKRLTLAPASLDSLSSSEE